MRVLIIRHGDPYYPTDSLTTKGQKEAYLLKEKLKSENITAIYVSPLGRAQLTAKPLADELHIEPIVLDWLKEFPAMLDWEYSTDIFQNFNLLGIFHLNCGRITRRYMISKIGEIQNC